MNRCTPTAMGSAMRRRLWRSASQFIEYPRVVEVRHSSWNDAATLVAFTRKDIGFCNIEQPVCSYPYCPTPTTSSGAWPRPGAG